MKNYNKKYDWWVYSTAIASFHLLVECKKTKALGFVENPTEKEWNDAFYAPSKPYPWDEHERVIIIKEGSD